MIKTSGRFLPKSKSKNEQIQFLWLTNVFDSNLNTINLKLFRNHGGIKRLEKKFKKYSGEINPLWVHRNMRGCILKINSEGQGWKSTVCSCTILLILIWGLRYSSNKTGQQNIGGADFEIGDIGTSAHLHWRLKKIPCRACLLFCGDKK